jgi:hypothetical protein
LPGETGPIKIVTIVVGVCVVSARAAAAPQIRATLEQSTAIAFALGRSSLKVLRLNFPPICIRSATRGRSRSGMRPPAYRHVLRLLVGDQPQQPGPPSAPSAATTAEVRAWLEDRQLAEQCDLRRWNRRREVLDRKVRANARPPYRQVLIPVINAPTLADARARAQNALDVLAAPGPADSASYFSTRISFLLTNSSMPYRPSSLPKPDRLTPPKGSSAPSSPTPLT